MMDYVWCLWGFNITNTQKENCGIIYGANETQKLECYRGKDGLFHSPIEYDTDFCILESRVESKTTEWMFGCIKDKANKTPTKEECDV